MLLGFYVACDSSGVLLEMIVERDGDARRWDHMASDKLIPHFLFCFS